MSRHPATKFVVFTTNRSGSTWLMSTLNHLPNVTGQGELFLPRPRSTEKRWDSDFACPRFVEAQAGGSRIRPFAVFSYLDALYNSPGVVGFKLMYEQLGLYPEIALYLMRRRIRVVHLVRQNHLDVVVSYAVKAKLGQAHLLSGQRAPADMGVELDPKKLLDQLTWLHKKQQLARRLLRWCRLPHIEVTYEDLLRDPAHFRRIVDFLALGGVETMPQSTLLKIRQGGHREVIRNYQQVREVLMNSQFTGLLE
jgi:LPS sulfotransferase NodH